MDGREQNVLMDLREALGKPVSEYTSTDFVRVLIDDTVTAAAMAMREGRATEAVVADGGGLIGIITERDILYKVVAEGLDPARTTVRVVMSAPVETVEEASKVGDAIAKMSKLGVRRLGVTRSGKFVGLVTQKNIASGRLGTYVSLPELAKPGAMSCPYCGESVRDSKELSRHIDRVHLGLGLLEGNLRKW